MSAPVGLTVSAVDVAVQLLLMLRSHVVVPDFPSPGRPGLEGGGSTVLAPEAYGPLE